MSRKVDDHGKRMKLYEHQESARRFTPLLPVCARLDGKNFSKFTKGLKTPYDERLSNLMQLVTRLLVEETNACMGYTESDEISLVFYSDDAKSQIFFDGKIQKMTSVLASMCTAWFNLLLPKYLPEKSDQPAFFDCRVWTVPNKVEAVNVLVWREKDAVKNSISSAARCYYSHNQLHKKTGKEMQELLFQKGINWNDYPRFFKRGTYVQRKTVMKKFSAKELERLPEKHEARQNPDLEIERTVVEFLDLPPITQVENRVDVVFEGAEPKLFDSEE